jgi:hypothetical protein
MKNLTILPPSDLPAATPPDAFREDRVLYDLAKLAHSPGLFQSYVERARVRFTKAAEKAVLEHWVSFYQAGGRLIDARLEMERRKSEYLRLADEHRVKAKENEATIAAHEADIAEHHFRCEVAEYKRRNLDRFVEGGRPPVPSEDLQPRLTADQQREKRHANSEARLQKLKALKQEALKLDDSDERMQKVNAVDDEIQQEMDQWRKTL